MFVYRVREEELVWIERENEYGFKIANRRATLPSYRHPETAFKTMRVLQLLIKRFNETAWIAILGQHIVTSTLLVVSAFSTIHFFGFHNFGTIPDALGYLIYPAGMSIFFIWVILVQPLCANVKIRSQLLRAAWKNKHVPGNPASTEMMKFIDSCHDLNVNLGCFFSYQVSTMPKVFDICVGQTITLLLSAKNT